MTPEQQHLALDLAYGVWGTRKIEPEEFLRRFGESDGQALARRLVAEAIADEDGHDLEASLIVVFAFGVTPELLDPLKHLATVEWHSRHEDVVTLLQDLHNPETVDVLSRLTEWAPARLDDFDAGVLATKATWALYKTGGAVARRALERVRDSATDDDLRELAGDLLSRKPAVRPARVRFLTVEEGGRITPAAPGTRSQLDLGESQTSCVVDDDSGRETFPPGEEVEVQIRTMFPWAEREFRALRTVNLYEGSKLVAVGEFLDQP